MRRTTNAIVAAHAQRARAVSMTPHRRTRHLWRFFVSGAMVILAVLTPAEAWGGAAKSANGQNATQAEWRIYTNANVRITPLRLRYALRAGWLLDAQGDVVRVMLSPRATQRLTEGLSIADVLQTPPLELDSLADERVLIIALEGERVPLPAKFTLHADHHQTVEAALQALRVAVLSRSSAPVSPHGR